MNASAISVNRGIARSDLKGEISSIIRERFPRKTDMQGTNLSAEAECNKATTKLMTNQHGCV